MESKRQRKWRSIFGHRGRPKHEKSKDDDTPSSSKDHSNFEDGFETSQVLTEAEVVSTEPATSLVVVSTNTNAESGSLILPDAVIPENVEDVAAQTLWDRAYDAVRDKDERLINEYEELLSWELSLNTGTQNPDKPTDYIDKTNVENRQEQLKTITHNGLRRMDETKTKYVIFGHEFVPRDQIAQAGRFVQGMKTLVDEAVRACPEASLIWAGVCTILPILTNPVAAQEAHDNGFTYVTSRMQFYVELEHLLWPTSLRAGLRQELETRLIVLYQQILDFQVRSVIRFYKTQLARLGGDVVQSEDWKGMLSRVQDLEKTFDDDLSKINDSLMRKELEALNEKTGQFLSDMRSVLLLISENHTKSASLVFDNHGAGHQLNTTGGTQNNNMGNGIQLTGVTFAAPVQFGLNVP